MIRTLVKRRALRAYRRRLGPALAMYSDRESFADFHRERGEACDYEAMRDDLRALGHDWIVHESALDATPLHEHGAHRHAHDSGHHHP